MNIILTHFSNPFSFFCLLKENGKDIDLRDIESGRLAQGKKFDYTNVNHGQYVAVMWSSKWVRGVVTMESQCRIWLIDFGIYLRPNEKMVYIDLPTEYKKFPSNVFEASIHGVMPVDKVVNSECEIENDIATTWNKAAIERIKELIKKAHKTIFVPIAMLSTNCNDVVIGDLYFEIDGRSVNVIEELGEWPVFAQKNSKMYIQNLQTFYTSRRRHRACLLKPDFPKTNLPNITLEVTLEQYENICDDVPSYQVSSDFEVNSGDGATIITLSMKICNNTYKLSSAEIEKYANMIIIVGGVEYNALQILLNKIKDLKMCERYKDLKSVGRATSRRTTRMWDLKKM